MRPTPVLPLVISLPDIQIGISMQALNDSQVTLTCGAVLESKAVIALRLTPWPGKLFADHAARRTDYDAADPYHAE